MVGRVALDESSNQSHSVFATTLDNMDVPAFTVAGSRVARSASVASKSIGKRAKPASMEPTSALKPREFQLLVELARNPDIALSRERLLQKVWGFDYVGDGRTVDVHVHRLRLKLEAPWRMASIVATVQGFE